MHLFQICLGFSLTLSLSLSLPFLYPEDSVSFNSSPSMSTTKLPLQATVPNPKPNSNFRFSGVAVNLNLGFVKRSRNRGRSKLWWVDERGEMRIIRKLSRGCFKGRTSKEESRKVEVESANAGEDVFDAAAAEADHLVIMVNGIIGRYYSAFFYLFIS